MIKDLTRSRNGTRWLIIDFLVGIIAFYLGYQLSPYTETAEIKNIFAMYFLYGVVLMLSTRLIGVPRVGKDYDVGPYVIIVTSCLASIIGCFGFLVFTTFIFYEIVGRYILLGSALAAFIGISGIRLLVWSLHRQRPVRVALGGCNLAMIENVKDLCHQCKDIQVVALIDTPDQAEPESLPNFQSRDIKLYEKLQQVDIEIVVVSDKEGDAFEGTEKILRLPLYGIELMNYRAFLENYFNRIVLDLATFEEIASLQLLPGNSAIFWGKRCVDIGLSLPGLMLTGALCPFVALMIKLESRGPVFFGQLREGYQGKPFMFWKFRTMVEKAEENGAQWAGCSDPRITRVGRLLRLMRVDEFPQFWNVLKGDMSLVGPRPERPEFTEDLVKQIPYYDYRYLVRPGITGWAQISYRYGASEEDAKRKLEYDLYYIRHLSLMFDCCILLKTVPLVMRGSR